jgi:hypothetical protein
LHQFEDKHRQFSKNRSVETKNKGDKSAAIFCCQGAASVLDMICSFYILKNNIIATISSTTKAGDKNKHIFRIFI